jgi:predicted nucleic acid-binding protein
MRIILDANMLVSAYTCDGKVRDHYLHNFELVEIFISPEIFIEFERHLRRKEFGLSPSEIPGILSDVLTRCLVTRISSKPNNSINYGTDWHIYALAKQIEANCVVTNDKGFSKRAATNGIKCMQITDFVSEYKKNPSEITLKS